ncbi:hypothetical protein FB451DRAFT_1373329 [Mycena latifolia]|nr:hypothetical protein FB451DRAFT_1373329 [Mycena latifolia]
MNTSAAGALKIPRVQNIRLLQCASDEQRMPADLFCELLAQFTVLFLMSTALITLQERRTRLHCAVPCNSFIRTKSKLPWRSEAMHELYLNHSVRFSPAPDDIGLRWRAPAGVSRNGCVTNVRVYSTSIKDASPLSTFGLFHADYFMLYLGPLTLKLSEALHAVDMCFFPPNAPPTSSLYHAFLRLTEHLVFNHIISSRPLANVSRYSTRSLAELFRGANVKQLCGDLSNTPESHGGPARHTYESIAALMRLGVRRNAKALVCAASETRRSMARLPVCVMRARPRALGWRDGRMRAREGRQ